jgi:predicted RecB family nuclease
MRLTASDLNTHFRPSKCDLRVYLRHTGERETPPGPYEQVLFRLAERHKKAHLATFPEAWDLSSLPLTERLAQTAEALKKRISVVYQGALSSVLELDGVRCEILGEPDFLIRGNVGYILRDSTIAKRIDINHHREIIYRLQLYGLLYERMFRARPEGLEVHSGPGDIVPVEYDSGAGVLNALRRILKLKGAGSEFYSAVGWSKCGHCGFHDRCWQRAERDRDVAIVRHVDQGLACVLHRQKIVSVDDLLRLSESQLAAIRRPWGHGTQRVGNRAGAILCSARALQSGQEILLSPPYIGGSRSYAIFDLEGLPPYLDELEKVYLWGIQVFGEQSCPYRCATAGLGPDGDRQAWETFLRIAQGIFAEFGDVPFVHWSHYERTRLDLYIERFGDRSGIAGRVRRNLLDLLRVIQEAVVLPLPSYSLKVVEKYIGFRRALPELNGEWAMAKYMEAIEMGDGRKRDAVMQEICEYNREDLQACRAVLEWLMSKWSWWE